MKNLVIMIGIQGSGKSHFCEKFLKETHVRINLDTLGTRHRERLLFEEFLAGGVDCVIDNTNPTRADRARYIPSARAAGYRIIGYFVESKLKECIKRNALREGKSRVPSCAIAATSNKLELPSYNEGFDELYFVKNDGKVMSVEEWRV